MDKPRSSIALLKQTLAAEGNPGPYQVMPLAKIRPNPGQPRRRFAEDLDAALSEPEFLELVASVKAVGRILQPLLVEPPDPLGCHQIIAGERRYHAALAAGLTEAPVLIEEESDPFTLKLYALIENLHRQDLSLWERARYLADLLAQSGLSKKELAARIGISPSQLSKYLTILDGPADLTAAVQERIVSDTEAVRFLKDSPPEVRKPILEQARTSGQPISRRSAERAITARHKSVRPYEDASLAAPQDQVGPDREPPDSPLDDSTVPLPRLTRPQLQALLRHLGADHIPEDPSAIGQVFLLLVDRLT